MVALSRHSLPDAMQLLVHLIANLFAMSKRALQQATEQLEVDLTLVPARAAERSDLSQTQKHMPTSAPRYLITPSRVNYRGVGRSLVLIVL